MKETLPGLQDLPTEEGPVTAIAITLYPIKRHVHIDEVDNGYRMSLDAGMLHQELVFEDYKKLVNVLAKFLKDAVGGTSKEDKRSEST
jgi:hypothetical protein